MEFTENTKTSKVISNVMVYGISESMIASGYPMIGKTGPFEDFPEMSEYLTSIMDDAMEQEQSEHDEGLLKKMINCVDNPNGWSMYPLIEHKELVSQVKNRSMICDNETECEEFAKSAFKRVQKLANTPLGSGHDNFLNGIVAQFDLTFTIKAWTEAERYHFLDFVSSQSTMHRMQKMDVAESVVEYVDSRVVDVVEELVRNYNQNPTTENRLKMLYSCPVGLKLTARMTTNYRQLKTIYNQRWNHTLPEWRMFCKQLKEDFPLFSELCLRGDKNVD